MIIILGSRKLKSAYSGRIIIFMNMIIFTKSRMESYNKDEENVYEENVDEENGDDNSVISISPEIIKDENESNRIEFTPVEKRQPTPRRNALTYTQFMHYIVSRFFQGSILPQRPAIFSICITCILYVFFICGVITTSLKVSSDAILYGIDSPGFPNNIPLQYQVITDYPGCKDMRMEVWRIFTYQFVHLSVIHILTNSLSILVYGFLAEAYITSNSARLQTIFAYEFGVILGILGQVYTDGYYRVIGSSAGAYGLIGLTTSIMLSGDTTPFGEFAILNTLPIQMLLDLLYFTVLYTPNVAYTAHFAGFIAGIAVGNIFYIFSIKNKRTNWDKIICVSGILLGVLEIVFLIYHYMVVFPPRFHINPTFDKPYPRLACCLDAFYLLAGNNSMTMDSIRNNYKCRNKQLVLI
jgi:membrane associated rhomboid family serine protease